MPRQNVEIVRRWLAAFNSWDVAGFVELWDPDCEFFTLFGSQLAGAPYQGHDGSTSAGGVSTRRACATRPEGRLF